MSALAAISPKRKRRNKVMQGVLGAGTALAIIPLVAVILFIVIKGLKEFNWEFLTTDPNTSTGFALPGKELDLGGIKSAILGTLIIVALASAIAIPLGVAVAVWLVEYGRASRVANLVRYFIDVMTGVPSIVFGLFIYILLVGDGPNQFVGYKGSIALALLMLPVVARSAEVVLLLVPQGLRESALALGAPRWRTIFRVVLPTALPGILTGALLAVARAAGETAPLLYTVKPLLSSSLDPSQPMDTLPLVIFSNVGQPSDQLVNRAWAAAMTLVIGILLVTVAARLIARRSRL